MKNLKISPETAIKLYPTASPEFKIMLEETFGIDLLKPKTLFKKIKAYEDVCRELSESSETCPYKQMKQIERLFNGDWRKDWSNSNQKKWRPWFQYKAGLGLVFDSSTWADGDSSGSVAYFKDQQTSDFVGRTFPDIYNKL